MRLIDADALKSYIDCGHLRSPIETCFSELDVVLMLDKQPTVDAEPVRHAENTTFIDTDDVSKWKSRVVVCERNSHWGRLYYESDTKYGKWVFGGDGCVVCSECNEEEPNNIHRNYCPNCGAKMGGAEDASNP